MSKTKFSNFCFVKSGKIEHMKSLQKNGLIYMKSLEYFTKIEDELRRDPLETVCSIRRFNEQDKLVMTFEGSDAVLKIQNLSLYKHGYDYFVYCLHFIDGLERFDTGPFNLSCKGESLLFINGPKFIQSLNMHLSKLGISPIYAPVIYKEFSTYSGAKTPLEKDIKYKTDSEWRLLIPRTQETEDFSFEIGSLKNFSILHKGKLDLNTFELSNAEKHPEVVEKKLPFI